MNTMQQEFDAVVAHLYAQGRPAKQEVAADSTSFASCRYRSGTLSCAVGCRIPDSVYVEDMDKSDSDGGGTSVARLITRFGEVLPPEIKAYEQMFARLQGVHDGGVTDLNGSFKLEYLEQDLREIAKMFELTFTVPTKQGE